MAAARMGGNRYAASAAVVVALCAGALFSSPIAFASLYGSGLYGAGAYGGTTTVPPQQALNPSPADEATSVSTSTSLSWTAGSGATAHAVYFGTDSTPDESEYQGNQAGSSYNPGLLAASTTYYWRIDEVNASGTTTGAVWSFTTADAGSQPAPTAALSPTPADLLASVSTSTSLSWTAGSGATTRGVYFGTGASLGAGEYKGNQAETTYDPGPLAENTTYWWRIDEANAQGTTSGPLWSFTTVAAPAPGSLPDPATSPAPTSGAAGVSTGQELSWTAGSGATAHAVYFGTDSTPDESEYQGNQAGTTYGPSPLSRSTTYYWRIDEVNSSGTTTGTVWSFTTSAPSSGGACLNCGSGSSGGGSSPAASTTGDKPTGATATSTIGGSSTSIPFRCPETAPAADGLSGAGLVNLLVSLGIVPSTKAKTACGALTSAKAALSAPALSSGSFRFSTPLSKGMRSAEVRQLQQFLNTRGFVLTSGTELGAPGYETDLFGLLTEDAVKRFQAAYAAEILAPVGLAAPSGFFGPSTIRQANALVGA